MEEEEEETEEVDRDGDSDLTGALLGVGEQVLLHSSFRANRGLEPGPWWLGVVDSLVWESTSSCGVTKDDKNNQEQFQKML